MYHTKSYLDFFCLMSGGFIRNAELQQCDAFRREKINHKFLAEMQAALTNLQHRDIFAPKHWKNTWKKQLLLLRGILFGTLSAILVYPIRTLTMVARRAPFLANHRCELCI